MVYEQEEGERPERKYSEEQYQMLLRCSEKKDVTEWNEWRKDNPNEEILLCGVELGLAVLKGVHLKNADLEGVRLSYANLEGSDLYRAHLERAVLNGANLKGADLRCAHLEGAKLGHAHLEGAQLPGAHLEGTDLRKADLESASLEEVHLENADVWRANLRGANLYKSHLGGTSLVRVFVNGTTSFWKCEVDRNTLCHGVGLSGISIQPGTRQLLEYNVRRMNWEDWYKGHWFWRWPVRWFWALSDYGRSTGWVIAWFLIFAAIFAGIYWIWGLVERPGIVSNLFELEGTTEGVYKYAIVDMMTIERQPGEPIKVSRGMALVRAVYFSVVTMTTLGFGDLYANPLRIAGHILLAIQVILGYVLLGALITRFAVLFTAGGPAGKFAKKK